MRNAVDGHLICTAGMASAIQLPVVPHQRIAGFRGRLAMLTMTVVDQGMNCFAKMVSANLLQRYHCIDVWK